MISIKIKTRDENICYSVICQKTDKMNDILSKLYCNKSNK